MLIETDTLNEALCSHDADADAFDALLKTEALARRYRASYAGTPGSLESILNRAYAFICAHSGDGNATNVDLEHRRNTPNELRAELERLLPDVLTHHGVTLANLHGPNTYTYWRMSADAYEHDTDHAPEDQLTKAELYGRLEGHVIDVGVAVRDLEANPGAWTRLTDFAFYRAVYVPPATVEPDIECPNCGVYHYGEHRTSTLCPGCLKG